MVAPFAHFRDAAIANGVIEWSRVTTTNAAPDLPRPDETSLLDTMVDLSRILRGYFHMEESYDHAAIGERSPQLRQRIVVLQTEHRELLASLDQRLAETARNFEDQCMPEDCRRVFEWFEAFEQQLLKHEARERQLLGSAYVDDLGVGD